MKLAAALVSGVFVSLITAALMGIRPPLRLGRQGKGEARQLWLAQAGLKVTPFQFVLISAGIGAFALVILLGISGVWAVALPPSALIALLPRLYFARVRNRRMSEVRKAWPDGIRDLLGAVSSGQSVQRALENLARSGPAPLQEAFGRFPVLVRTMGWLRLWKPSKKIWRIPPATG